MKLKKMLLLSMNCINIHLCIGQKIYLKNPIFLDIKNQYVEVINPADSSVYTNFGADSSKYIKIFNSTNKGSLSFQILDTSYHIAVTGNYIETGLLLKKEQRIRKLGGGKGLTTLLYYKPLRNGCWRYYNYRSELIAVEYYIKGKLKKIR